MKKTYKTKIILPFRVALTLCAAWGWWGILYPELTMTSDTYRIVYEDGTVQTDLEVVEWDFDNDIYKCLLEADSSQIHFRSRLFTNINALQEQGRGIHESGEQ
ncbi:MAG: hypothetical protein IJF07_09520 [Lachnospiraceae bacterium]|nr:hypothetical protein [Lachnospiraceae bacterium]